MPTSPAWTRWLRIPTAAKRWRLICWNSSVGRRCCSALPGCTACSAYVVAQRTREIGLRMALGAQRRQALWLVFRHAGALVLGGVGIGMVLAAVSARFVRVFLYGVAEHDLWTLVIVALVLIMSGGLAAFFPARRAAQVNPIEALRAE